MGKHEREGAASEAAEKVSIRIRVCLQAYRKSPKMSPSLDAEQSLAKVDGRGGEPAVYRGCIRHYAASASNAVRLRITSVDPSKRMNSFFLRSLSKRVTVSRDEPIICAISSWVRLARTRISGGSNCSRIGVHDSSNLASLPAEERASTKSWISR